ncbi:sulfotransferase domain-containing protein [Cryptosporangium phraense]|uniref:Sulfotransferase domain-containing protein n=1 Tax=Cryptosporangium phraense TaxID=2593070 RepID=A0A545ADS1_9ACTN|nr:sulfotransferase domain-containing protein [Cryptosporangium phraense]TQS39488.1 sulfotransferase domain-containing protein [Cryptosporangium phraense]
MGKVYRSGLTDSGRWERVELRSGDVVISAPSKCGNTWLQMICALLIFGSPELPAPLTSLSPWVDMRLRPLDELCAVVAAQRHRRFLKTHTPLDGVPEVSGVTYLVIGRDPRDVAVSMDHHRANLDEDRIRGLLGVSGADRVAPTDRRERVLRWIYDDRPAVSNLDSLRSVVGHLCSAWERRDDPAVVLLHYADLLGDLDGQMRRIAARLEIGVPCSRWESLVAAATFSRMRARAADLVPDERLGLFDDKRAFFRSGGLGQWRTVLTSQDIEAYAARLRSLAPAAFVEWVECSQPNVRGVVAPIERGRGSGEAEGTRGTAPKTSGGWTI